MSGKSSKKVLLLAKKEVVYGTDPVLTGANGILVSNLNFQAMVPDMIKRDTIKGFKGNGGKVLGQKYTKITFDVEVGGHGGMVVGALPAIDCLLSACDLFAEQQSLAIAIVQAGGTATVTLNNHGKRAGDKVTVFGAGEGGYNLTGATILTVPNANTFTYAVAGATASPATGAPKLQTGRLYSPTPDTEDLASCAFYGYQDGTVHKALGGRGNVSLEFNAKGIPKFKFEFTAIYADPADAANPTGDFSAFTDPKAVNFDNTPEFTLHGFSAPLELLSLNLNNQVIYRDLPMSQSVLIPDREPSGQAKFEACTLAEKDFFALAEAQTEDELTFIHGVDNGNIVEINCPKVTVSPPEYGETDSILMMTCNLELKADAGNDEITLLFR